MLTDDLLALQRVDSAIDQLRLRRDRLAEIETAKSADAALAANRDELTRLDARSSELEAAVAAAEAASADIDTHRARLEAQLKTIIAPREAEALMHEIDTLAARRSEIDDTELEHLEEESQLDERRAELLAAQPPLVAAAEAAAEALAAARRDIDEQVAANDTRRADLSGALAAAMLGDYEARRARQSGVAIAALEGRTCSGCHLDLSTSELEEVKRTPAGEPADCPQCGRWLVP